jgi:basic amino acid/polyamine antiporter, APA family
MVLLIVGTVIGSGIFLVPGVVLRDVGNSVPWAIGVWLLGGLLSLLGALTYGELSAMNPAAGGLYIYIRDCFGPLVAFIFGWTLFFVVSTGSTATLAVAFSSYLKEFVPLSMIGEKGISILVIAIIVGVNVRGTRQSADLQNWMTAIKVFAILAMATALLWFGRSPSSQAALGLTANTGRSLMAGVGLAIISVLWAYEGWQYATFAAGETLNPQRTFPLAFLLGSGALIVIYVYANFGYIAALGADGVASSNRVAAEALAIAVNPAVARLATAAILVSIFSAANSIILTSTRVYYAMAKDGLFFKKLAQVHPRFGTPAFAIVSAGGWASLLAASGTFEQLLTYVIFIGWSFYALAAATIFVYRRREPEIPRPYRVPGYPWTPLIFIMAVAAMVANVIVSQPARAALGFGIVLTGIPAYAFWRKRRKEIKESL